MGRTNTQTRGRETLKKKIQTNSKTPSIPNYSPHTPIDLSKRYTLNQQQGDSFFFFFCSLLLFFDLCFSSNNKPTTHPQTTQPKAPLGCGTNITKTYHFKTNAKPIYQQTQYQRFSGPADLATCVHARSMYLRGRGNLLSVRRSFRKN